MTLHQNNLIMEKPKITFSTAYHKKEQVLLIRFRYNQELKEYLKLFSGIRWSTTLRSFYLPFNKKTTNSLYLYLRTKNYYIDYTALKTAQEKNSNAKKGKKIAIGNEISIDVQNHIGNFKKWMAQKRYSENTIHTYISMLQLFFRYQHPKKHEEINQTDILRFNTDYILANGFSYTYQNQMVNAIKLFYKQQDSTNLSLENIERPKKSKKLPQVLSIDEVKRILIHTSNLKHKTLLSLLYACGLRIGEALKLKIKDIDEGRGFMHIQSAKGAKDRYVPIPKQMILVLRQYIKAYNPRFYVFEGQNGGMYTAVSARQVLKRSIAKAEIQKPITLHTLRHSHATHLLENGTDLRFIQELLGHNSPKTTMIYTHVSTTSLDKIKNPFDDFEL